MMWLPSKGEVLCRGKLSRAASTLHTDNAFIAEHKLASVRGTKRRQKTSAEQTRAILDNLYEGFALKGQVLSRGILRDEPCCCRHIVHTAMSYRQDMSSAQ